MRRGITTSYGGDYICGSVSVSIRLSFTVESIAVESCITRVERRRILYFLITTFAIHFVPGSKLTSSTNPSTVVCLPTPVGLPCRTLFTGLDWTRFLSFSFFFSFSSLLFLGLFSKLNFQTGVERTLICHHYHRHQHLNCVPVIWVILYLISRSQIGLGWRQ